MADTIRPNRRGAAAPHPSPQTLPAPPSAAPPEGTPSETALPDGPWLDHLDPNFLKRAYPHWASEIVTFADAAAAFRRFGFPELAALSEAQAFDPDYFAEANPAWQGAPTLDAYRDWLMDGIGAGRPGSPAAHMRGLGFALDLYPACFPWKLYAALRPSGGAHRWAALDDFCADGFGQVFDRLPFGPDAAPFLAALGRVLSQKDDKLAIHAYELARRLDTITPTDRQHLADAYFRLDMCRPAFELYSEVVASPDANAWTIRNLSRCANRLGRQAELRAAVDAVRERLAERPMWIEAVTDATDAIFRTAESRARALIAEQRHEEAERLLVSECMELAAWSGGLLPRVPKAGGDKAGGAVLVLANLDDAISADRQIARKLPLLDRLGIAHRVVSYQTTEGFLDALGDASFAIFFRVPALPLVLRCIMAARRCGLPTYYATDMVPLAAAHAPPIAEYRGYITSADYDGLRFAMPLYRAAAQLCDFGLAPTGRIAESLRPLVARRRAFAVGDLPDSPQPPAQAADGERMSVFVSSRALAFLDAAPETPGGALLRLMEQTPALELCISGPVHLDPAFDRFAARLRHLGPERDPRAHRDALAHAAAALLALPATADGEYETEAAWFAAASVDVPAVVLLPEGTLPRLRHGENVLRAPRAADWHDCVARLLADVALRARIAAGARRSATDEEIAEAARQSFAQALAAGKSLIGATDT